MSDLKTYIEQTAAMCQAVSVKVCRTFGTVVIRDLDGVQDDIFMQGGDADQFIAEFDALVELAPDVLFEDAVKAMAEPYVSVLWH
jgi:hypothetical protein